MLNDTLLFSRCHFLFVYLERENRNKMPNINDKDCVEYIYSTDGCDECCELREKPRIGKFEDFDTQYAPLFVDMLFTGAKVRHSEITKDPIKDGYKFYIYLRTPMEVGTIFYTDTHQRDYFLAEFKGVERDNSYVYRVKSMDNCSVNELDRNNLRKGLTIHRKGILTNEL